MDKENSITRVSILWDQIHMVIKRHAISILRVPDMMGTSHMAFKNLIISTISIIRAHT